MPRTRKDQTLHFSAMDTDYVWKSKTDPRFNGDDWDRNELGKPQTDTGRSVSSLPPRAREWLKKKSEELGVPIPDDLEWSVLKDGMPAGRTHRYKDDP
jgi:hypothetical protein